MQELYESVSSLFSLSFIWFFNDVTAWNWFSMLIESIIQMIIIAALMISKSFLKFVMFFFHCIAFHSTFHLKHVNRMCLIDIWSLSHSHVVITISSTHLSCRNWLKSIFLMCNCVNNALWDFAWSLCRCRCWWVIFNVRYWKWAALNFSLQTILHVCLICFCMSISCIIISVRWCLINNRDNSCTSSIILFTASFLSTSACSVTQCNFSVTSWDWMFSCAVWTHHRRVWFFVDIMTFTVFKKIWLSLYILYIFSWHSWFAVATSARCFIFATNSFSSLWWVMTKVNSFNLLSSFQFILIMIAVTSSLLLLSFE